MEQINHAVSVRKLFSSALYEYPLVAFCGGTLYCLTEVLWRGWTHISMALCGALCLSLFYFFESIPRFRAMLWITRALLGGGIITVVEFAAGCIVNLVLGLSVWSYAGMPYNLLGQICLPMSALWVILAGGAFLLCDLMRKTIFLKK